MKSDHHRRVKRSGGIGGKPITLCPNRPKLRDDQNDIKDVGKMIKMALRAEMEGIPSSSGIKCTKLSTLFVVGAFIYSRIANEYLCIGPIILRMVTIVCWFQTSKSTGLC
jgi:hypothetical protein